MQGGEQVQTRIGSMRSLVQPDWLALLAATAVLAGCGGGASATVGGGAGADPARGDAIADLHRPARREPPAHPLSSAVDACPYSPQCYLRGECKKEGAACKPGDDNDCRFSQECASLGHCRLSGGRCSADADGCRNSLVCFHAGQCSSDGNDCIAAADSCAGSESCREEAKCSIKGGVCVRGSDADCETSGLCKREGKCVITGRFEVCAATKAEHCQQADVCTKLGQEGQCRLQGNDCVR
jgi:hypothetical protein